LCDKADQLSANNCAFFEMAIAELHAVEENRSMAFKFNFLRSHPGSSWLAKIAP
jgi:hypothetical protein